MALSKKLRFVEISAQPAKTEGIKTSGQGRAFSYCPPDLDRQVESDPKRVSSASCTEETPCDEPRDRNEYDVNLLLFVVRYGEPPSLGMSTRWRRERKQARRRSAVIVLYDGA